MTATADWTDIAPDALVRGPFFPETLRVVRAVPFAGGLRLEAVGTGSQRFLQYRLSTEQLAQVEVLEAGNDFLGDPGLFKRGVEALRLGLAYEYDPYFALSVARVDPLPHQLEAVYHYFLRLPRIRFLLADDPGAGKTIMAGLLLKELKARGLAQRVLLVVPANLTFQWQREMEEKFRERFEVVRGEQLRATYGMNPFAERNQVITSLPWVARIPDAKDSLLRCPHWDLVVVDEAHKMSATRKQKTLAYRIGEELRERTDHLLLLTATPHKGDKDNFCLFLELLDRDVYADVRSLEEAMARNSAPFYLRRTKEALVGFPDPETGKAMRLFTRREVRTAKFEMTSREMEFYQELTRYVEEQATAAAEEESPLARATGFLMAMLQRRFASSVYACRRSLERMQQRRQEVLKNPQKYLQEQQKKDWEVEDLEDLEDAEREQFEADLERAVLHFDPTNLREEIRQLEGLIDQARALEAAGVESKLEKLRQVVTDGRLFADPQMKLLLFTEHKDTLDYLAGDGKDGRPLGKLREWGLKVCQIHGGMKIGDRDTPGTRLYAEREFRESAQVLAATEAAGEGINLQFCWFMINYDIPWNPVRLEQRMGRIHRYGQEHDCLVYNFVAQGTREGKVLLRLLDRLEEIRQELSSESVFDVIGEILPGNQLERMFRDLYARKTSVPDIEARLVSTVSPERVRAITESALEGLARRSLNLAPLVASRAEAKERRLVPEVVEGFFREAAPLIGIQVKPFGRDGRSFRVDHLPRRLWAVGQDEAFRARWGHLGHSYQQVVFDKERLREQPTAEWVTPGHPLFEVVREATLREAEEALRRGTVLYEVGGKEPRRLDLYRAAVLDGNGKTVQQRLFVVEATMDGELTLRQPTAFIDLLPAPGATPPNGTTLPDREQAEAFLWNQALVPWQGELAGERERAVGAVVKHVGISLDALLARANFQLSELLDRQQEDPRAPGIAGRTAQAEEHVRELLARKEQAERRLSRESQCVLGDVEHLTTAWVVPYPEEGTRGSAHIVRDDEVEALAMAVAMDHERARGWDPEDVSREDQGFDLRSRNLATGAVCFIEVKGHGGREPTLLTRNEYDTARRLCRDYWLYVVYDCRTRPELVRHQDPARLAWEPVVEIRQYRIGEEGLQKPGTQTG